MSCDRRRSEAGAITIMVALSMVSILIAAAMVLDFGIARLDRQQNKAVADAAVAAGMRGLDTGDARTHSFSGVCQALSFLKANKPALSSLSWAPCQDPAQLALTCKYGDPQTYASYTGSANGISVEIRSPYDLATSGWPEEQLPSLKADQLPADKACNQVAVVVRQTRQPGLGSLATNSDLTTSVRSVGRVTEGTKDDQPVALLLLERYGCNAIVINGSSSSVTVLANGSSPGLIHADSSGEVCTGNERILVGDHANGIVAESGSGPGIIRVHSVGSVYGTTAYDSAANVVAEDGTVGPGNVVGRGPVDERYIAGARAAVADYEAQANTNGSSSLWTKLGCAATKAQLAAVTGPLWIDCKNGQHWTTFNTGGVTLEAQKIFFDAKSVSAPDLAMPNATRVYVRGDISPNGAGVAVAGGFSMGPGSDAGPCPDTSVAPSPTRARLVIGAGSFTATPSTSVRLCSTTIILGGGSTSGCIPISNGLEPADNSCNGRLSMSGTTDWTAPNKISGQSTPADWGDFEDLAVWSEASGVHDIGGGASMHLAGVFFLPNGDFKVHGNGIQDVRNSQYIARHFRADGNSQLVMQPRPYDVIGVPALTAFTMVR